MKNVLVRLMKKLKNVSGEKNFSNLQVSRSFLRKEKSISISSLASEGNADYASRLARQTLCTGGLDQSASLRICVFTVVPVSSIVWLTTA